MHKDLKIVLNFRLIRQYTFQNAISRIFIANFHKPLKKQTIKNAQLKLHKNEKIVLNFRLINQFTFQNAISKMEIANFYHFFS